MSRASAGGVANWPSRLRSFGVLSRSRRSCSARRYASVLVTSRVPTGRGRRCGVPISSLSLAIPASLEKLPYQGELPLLLGVADDRIGHRTAQPILDPVNEDGP